LSAAYLLTSGRQWPAYIQQRDIRLTFEIDCPADSGKIEKLVQLTERFCVIYQNLAKPPKLTSRYRSMTQV